MLRGVATWLPIDRLVQRSTGGTDDARYCYSIWLRHMRVAHQSGLRVDPTAVAELGPGDSLGIGLAALISGAEQYYAFDVREYANTERNIRIFDDLCTLFQQRAAIPGPDAFPQIKPPLADYSFPAEVLTDQRLALATAPDRLAAIRASITDRSTTSRIRYVVPWFNSTVVPEGSVDLVFSQAVLEHVDDLAGTYAATYRWLKPGGYMSHQIDLRSHDTAETWNGHWTYSDWTWRIIRGKRSYLINRVPASEHLRLIRQSGFEVVAALPARSESTIQRGALAPRFASLSDDDLTTSGLFVQARKPAV